MEDTGQENKLIQKAIELCEYLKSLHTGDDLQLIAVMLPLYAKMSPLHLTHRCTHFKYNIKDTFD